MTNDGRDGPPAALGVLTADGLCEGWRRRSLDAGWSLAGDWWTPAVETVTESLCDGRGLDRAFDRLGRARGRAGVGIGETINDLSALFDELDWAQPPIRLVRAVAEGWAEAGLVTSMSCEDPLTGLVTVPYLRSRIAEIYREAEATGTLVSDSHCLVMVELDNTIDPWRRLARAVVVGHDMREVFRGGETLTLVGTGRAAALVPIRPELQFTTVGLRRRLGGEHGALVWVERLPVDHATASMLLDELTG
jgi:hypothetical protein